MTINGRIDQHSQSIEAFFDSIGPNATSSDVRFGAAVGG
jgi:hypothetical protein